MNPLLALAGELLFKKVSKEINKNIEKTNGNANEIDEELIFANLSIARKHGESIGYARGQAVARPFYKSKKFWSLIVGGLIPFINNYLPSPISIETVGIIEGLIGSYLIGQGVHDSAKTKRQVIEVK